MGSNSVMLRDPRPDQPLRLGGRLYWSLRAEVEGLPDLAGEGEGVTIAILDGTVDQRHAAFAHVDLKPGFATTLRGGDASAEHGTAVASLILGRGPQGSGLAPRATGLPIAIFAGDGNVGVLPCSQDDLAVALEVALSASVDVINISGGGFDADGTPLPRLARALAACARAGVAVIAAAGNDGCACPHVPAASPGVLAVGALADDGSPLASSNWGEAYRGHSLAAPGERLPAAKAFGDWAEWSGTSYAAALTSGLVARLLSGSRRWRPDLRGADVVAALLDAARASEPSSSPQHLGGPLNPRRALDRLRAPAHTVVTAGQDPHAGTATAPRAAVLNPSGQARGRDDCIYAVGALGLAQSARRHPALAELTRSSPSFATQIAVREGRVLEPGWTWSLNAGGRVIAIIRPDGAFARENIAWLATEIQRQWAGEACRIALAGHVTGIDDATGLPILRPDRLGLTAWPPSSRPLARMARDAGRAGVDRALNFALTQLAAPEAPEPLQPASAKVLQAATGRPQQHETVVAFFDPLRRLSAGRRIWRATIDVSDVLPVFVDGPHEYWTP